MPILNAVLPGLPAKTDFRFTERPTIVAPGDRLSYRLAMVACSLGACSNFRSSYARLALLNFAARSLRLRSTLTRVARGIADPTDLAVRFDPFFPRVLDIAVAQSVATYLDPGPRFVLADAGTLVLRSIVDNDLFAIERAFFASVADSLTEKTVIQIVSGHNK
jgi:hypothetical protein